MTALPKKAVQTTGILPPDRQDRLAESILEALDDMEWNRKFAASQDFLEALADEGSVEYRAGKTRKLKV